MELRSEGKDGAKRARGLEEKGRRGKIREWKEGVGKRKEEEHRGEFKGEEGNRRREWEGKKSCLKL